MNLLEEYLIEVISEAPFTDEDWSEYEWGKGKKFIVVTAKFDTYAGVKTRTEIYSTDQWEEIKKKGYAMR